uniref:ADP,ATP carrier protein n=1 Tax=Paramoeba aestuarina TaxID=180227 RepID=A0A7S4K6X9_9EUKA|mmetsp:Transcript_16015/g.24948  ORF Transcript_16015/g.24948 Transcript_16015/m.24948 type:complete len:299 (+) Transcript_16015:35-931(+)
MEHAIELFAQAIQRIVEYPFQRVWAVYLNYNSLVKEGLIKDVESPGLLGALRSLTRSEYKHLFRHVKIHVLTGVGLSLLQFFNVVACEELCWQVESDILKQCLRSASVLVTIAISYPMNMIQFRWLVDTNESPETAYAAIQSISERGGFLGFFDGCLPSLLGSWVHRSLHSITALSLLPLMEACGRDANDSMGMFIVGYLSAATANVAIYPIDYLRRRMVISKKSREKSEMNDDSIEKTVGCSGSWRLRTLLSGTIFDFGKSICEKEGWSTLWDGCWATMGISTLKTGIFILIQALSH